MFRKDSIWNFHTKTTPKKSRPPSGNFRPNPPPPRTSEKSLQELFQSRGWLEDHLSLMANFNLARLSLTLFCRDHSKKNYLNKLNRAIFRAVFIGITRCTQSLALGACFRGEISMDQWPCKLVKSLPWHWHWSMDSFNAQCQGCRVLREPNPDLETETFGNVLLGRTPRGSCNPTLRRVLKRFFKGSAS